jgi:alpha 1,3-glucosidase
MWMQYPEVEGLYGIDDQYLIGSDLLVKPVTEPSVTETEIRFPLKHDWYDVDTMMRMPLSNKNDAFETVTVSSDIDKIPVYQRGGSIIARKPRLRRSTQMMINDPYTLYIALDQSSNKASGVLYMDDENSFDHEKKGYFGEAQINVDMNKFIGNKVSTHSSWISEEMIESRMVERIIIMGVQEAPAAMYLDLVQLTFSYDDESKVMVVRKPNFPALSEREITFSQETK